MEKDPDNGFAKPPAYDEADDLTTAFDKLHLPWLKELTLDKTKPTIDECIAHLKLLEAFSQLRDSIGLANGLYGIKDEFVPVNANDQEQQEILAKIREKRWAVYVTIATLRFQDYFQKAIQPQSYMLVQQDFEHAGYEDITDSGLRLKITSDNLPPLGEFSWKTDSIRFLTSPQMS